MERPYLNAKVEALEAAFERKGDDPAFLKLLIAELRHRKVPRAVRLLERARTRLTQLQRLAAAPINRQAAVPPPQPEVPPRVVPPIPPRSGGLESICDAWTALEVLSPQTFAQPHDLAPGRDRRSVTLLDRSQLPWERGGERSQPGKRLYYQIVLGSIDMEAAVRRMLTLFTDTRVERPPVRGRAAVAVVIVDSTGRPAGPPFAHLSSFGWGLPYALSGQLSQLAVWPQAEGPLVGAMEKQLQRTDAQGELLPLTREDLDRVYAWLIGALGIPAELAAPPAFAIRSYQYYRSPNQPEPLLLNSFFLRDLGKVRSTVVAGRVPLLVRQYLGMELPAIRPDLLEDFGVLEFAVAPERTPPARWPGPERHPLVLLQQAAVNLAIDEIRDGGILAVNGPPGTGKTTLLRDLVAAVVTYRAEVMVGFDDPASAFIASGEKLNAGGAWQHLYQLDRRLRGFEILVASSNNKAVENVSTELPGLKAVAGDATDLRYFKCLSDALRDQETWGLVAAVLGNAANRARFQRTFWWDKEVGLGTYLLAAAGTPQVIQVTDPDTGVVMERPPKIVEAEDPPQDHGEALRRWRYARDAFQVVLQRSRAHLDELAHVRTLLRTLPALQDAVFQAGHALTAAQDTERDAGSRVGPARESALHARKRLGEADRALADHEAGRPGFFARLLRTQAARAWQDTKASLVNAREQVRTAAADAVRARTVAEESLEVARATRDRLGRALLEVRRRFDEARRDAEVARVRFGDAIVDEAFFARGHEARQKATPWLDAQGQRLRDDVFVAAMRLHRAFVDAAARPLRHNLGVLMATMGGRKMPTESKQALLPDLWSSLFLVVPLVSTTFASVERMLGDLPPETFGWLLVDEAGQALPQAAAGALMRARRAVIVGDPLQIEPVVALPDSLTQAVCRHFGVDPDRFNAPAASVQTLADAATPYGAEFHTQQGSRSVGVPLLVHRRCADPMFRISNGVAYDRLMVQAKAPATSPVGEVLGPSRWNNVEGSAEDKWSPEEGRVVLDLLRRLKQAEATPDLYIVTPFVIVADQLRRAVRENRILENWVEDPWAWSLERIGTIHTVQGREAEAVIFVLGAPAPLQTGARGWAGGSPNLLNVAVTRAKERLYVVGNRRLWRNAGAFGQLDVDLPA